jgi:hypothetical protein
MATTQEHVPFLAPRYSIPKEIPNLNLYLFISYNILAFGLLLYLAYITCKPLDTEENVHHTIIMLLWGGAIFADL